MRKVTDFIVEKRYLILISFIIITVLCIFLMSKVNINHDISAYLPDDSETRIGMNIMEDEFSSNPSSSYNIMFKGLKSDEKKKIFEELKSVKNVSSVDYDDTEKYNKGEYTYYVINVDSEEVNVSRVSFVTFAFCSALNSS